MEERVVQDYVHCALDQEIRAISGHYVLNKEVRLPFQGRELLYLVGYGVLDSSCCGVGGLTYALVPGFIINWRSKTNEQCLAVSQVEPIRDDATRAEICNLIEAREVVYQVNFQ